MRTNYLKLFRSICNWRWYKDGDTFRVFMHLLLRANYADGNFMGVPVKRGEVAISFRSIADGLGISLGRVRTAVEHLEKTGEIAHRSNRNFSVFSILCYDKYQGEPHTNDTPSDTPSAQGSAQDGETETSENSTPSAEQEKKKRTPKRTRTAQDSTLSKEESKRNKRDNDFFSVWREDAV